ncbi:molybdenum ABC transporter substrate-binding protein [Ensifer adhaerens]|uniref:Molybdenum ABC transporter substrate-binding protein n=1 Tax=Ensifer adhaerens TaxID=106592 RepID=A0A0L8BHR3_ENSAD|nr:molybdate ABC transporter substrate-binding protein [Ensifer adhaerens]KOF14231.1 molybdenum ABC transporter substrate-binding protein [Ensifer adhaerens]
MKQRRQWLKGLVLALGVAWAGATFAPQTAMAEDKVTVFAAASLKNALDAINAEWQKESGKETTVSYAASSALAKQVEQGAPADVFISADLAWMDYLAQKKLIKDDTRSNLLGNHIVLVSSTEDAKPVEIKQGFDLAALIGDGRLAMGAVDSVPAGKYGKAALEKLGVWSSVEQKVAGAESVRAALLLVSRGEAPYGIVYQTDAAADPGVKVVGTFPEDSHPPIIYPIAITTDSKSADATAYVDFIKSDKAAPLFEKQGFTILK